MVKMVSFTLWVFYHNWEKKKPVRSFPRASSTNGMGKCQDLHIARKLCSHHQDQKWQDKRYKKAHLGKALKVSPFGGASHAKGILLENVRVEAKQVNSAIGKCFRGQLIKKSKKLTAFLPDDGCLNFTAENHEVLVAGFGCKRPRCWRHSWSPL